MKRSIWAVLIMVLMVAVTTLSACGVKYHAVFDSQLRGGGWLFPEYEFDADGKSFILKTKAEYDELFSEERKALYNTPETGDNPPLSFDFDTDAPYGSTDFDKKMLVIYVYCASCVGENFKLKNIQVNDTLLRVDYICSDPKGTAYNDALSTRWFVVTLDRLDIASAEFRQLRKVDGKWVAERCRNKSVKLATK